MPRKVIAREERLAQAPVRRMDESKNRFFKTARLSQCALRIIRRQPILPPGRFLNRLRVSTLFLFKVSASPGKALRLFVPLIEQGKQVFLGKRKDTRGER